MRHAYLIIAHRDFYVLEKFLELMDDENHDFFVHIDKDTEKASIPYDIIRGCVKKGKIYIYSIYSLTWGRYSIVETELFLFQQATQKAYYSYYHVCSGADLPIKPINEIKKFFHENNGKIFLGYQNKKIEEQFLDRVRFFYGYFKEKKVQKFFNKVLIKAQNEMGIDRITRGENFQKGSQWASLSFDFVKTILNQETWIRERFKNTFIPDEMYKQTIMLNSCHKPNHVNNTLRMIDWKRGNPYVWKSQDLDELLSSRCLFARKFDSSIDKEIIDLLYGKIKCLNEKDF